MNDNFDHKLRRYGTASLILENKTGRSDEIYPHQLCFEVGRFS